ncbi:hypothetical protein [Desulfopila aestuarii]|nr:hypothetical protein [Desulfopila aestuarii]
MGKANIQFQTEEGERMFDNIVEAGQLLSSDEVKSMALIFVKVQ